MSSGAILDGKNLMIFQVRRIYFLSVEQSGVEQWRRPNRCHKSGKYSEKTCSQRAKCCYSWHNRQEELTSALESPTLFDCADGVKLEQYLLLPETTAERAWSRLAFIVSDADGGEGTIEAVNRGKTVFLHAHGDNENDWRALLEIAKNAPSPPPLILTHQTTGEIAGMHNPGGFTDGDRVACIAMSLGIPIERITMLGTNTNKVGRWSGTTEKEKKLVKLQWMKTILQALEFTTDYRKSSRVITVTLSLLNNESTLSDIHPTRCLV